MILRLIQFKRPPRGLIIGLICFAVLSHLIISGRAELRGLAITPGVWAFGLLFGREERFRRTSRFEAALPVRGRDVYCAKIVEETLGGCIALLVLLITILSMHGAPAGITIAVSSEVGALLALGRIAEHAFRPAEATTPKWWGRIVGGLIELGSIAIAAQIPTTSHGSWVYVPIAGTVCFVALCVVGGIALFWSTWSSIPDALQLAPAAATIEKGREKKSRLPSLAWQPLLPALFGVGTLISTCALLACVGFGLELPTARLIAVVTCWFAIWGKLSIVRARDPWVFTLPLSRQRLFLIVVALPLGILALGSSIRLFEAPQLAKTILGDFVLVFAGALLPGLFVGVPSFARSCRVQWAYARLAIILAMIAAVIWVIAIALGVATGPNGDWPSVALPTRPPLLIAVCLAMAATAYCLGISGFRRMETRPPRSSLGR